MFVSTVLREPSKAELADYELTGGLPGRESDVGSMTGCDGWSLRPWSR